MHAEYSKARGIRPHISRNSNASILCKQNRRVKHRAKFHPDHQSAGLTCGIIAMMHAANGHKRLARSPLLASTAKDNFIMLLLLFERLSGP